ncbi:hypothetical protein EII12_07155 [Buchananella hordeovulneris]|uniref:hypothetical protein n=1 Tax=Buchananella hordeovulneris TaxID=52770 RepID=UPI000F5F717C|nr:hypothetical protein [Buchananella hordeovulneris]RRD51800.1 hypothetical protein EII12_07155 [Buchananella hordeovulneris]
MAASAPPPSLAQLYRRLDAAVDVGDWWRAASPNWWPADSELEIIAGAILVQNTAWVGAARALAALQAAGLLAPAALAAVGPELEELIRPAGFMRAKAASLRAAATWWRDRGAAARALPTAALRAELLAVRGIGPETADVVALYVFNRPVFVCDTYARRLLAHVGYPPWPTYAAAHRALAPQVAATELPVRQWQHLHALIIRAGQAARTGGWPAVLGGDGS